MKLRQFILIPLIIALAACSSEPFPYSPQFVSPTDVPPQVLAAPPAPHSPEFEHEIDSIIARQSHLTEKQKSVIASESHIAPEMIVLPVLGKQYTEANYPALYTLLKHAASDAWRISDTTEDYWQSPRPWYADNRVKLFVPSITRPGYPSGHTTTNMVWAYILGYLFPDAQDKLIARALQIGGHRIDGGAHFPHDVEGGRKLGKIIYSKMKYNPDFQEELRKALIEIDHVRKPGLLCIYSLKVPHNDEEDVTATRSKKASGCQG